MPVWEYVGVTGILGVVAIAIISIVSHFVTKAYDSTYDRQHAIFQESLERERLTIESVGIASLSGQQAAQEKRVEAIDELWKAYLEIKHRFLDLVTFFDITLPSDWNELISQPDGLGSLIARLNPAEIISRTDEYKRIEQYRPYISVELWLYFFGYQAYLGRTAMLVHYGIQRKGSIDDWREDDGVRQILTHTITQEELSAVTSSRNAAMSPICDIFEMRILTEIFSVVSGKQSSVESFRNLGEVEKLNEEIRRRT